VTLDEEKPAAKEVKEDGNPFTGGSHGSGGNPAPVVPGGAQPGAELNVPGLPPASNNTGSNEPPPPAPPQPGAEPGAPHPGGT
jgi:hypothetical protein